MTLVAPFFDDVAEAPKFAQAHWLKSNDGVRIRIAHWHHETTSKGTILIFPGRTEYIEKYGRCISEFEKNGFATLVIDWRGQGLSDRLTSDHMLGHVGDYSEYQLDVQATIEHAETLNLPKPYFLIGHSMGGCIALRAILNSLPVKAAAFSAPMWGIHISPILRPFAWGLSTISKVLRFSDTYAPKQTNKALVISHPFDGNPLTTHPNSFDYMRRQLKAHPELSLGGASLGWLNSSLIEIKKLSRLPPPDIPFLAFLGTDESIVEPAPIQNLVQQSAHGRLLMFDDAKHEILMEKPEHRDRAIDALTTFFTEQT